MIKLIVKALTVETVALIMTLRMQPEIIKLLDRPYDLVT